jgi:hypothetical protein
VSTVLERFLLSCSQRSGEPFSSGEDARGERCPPLFLILCSMVWSSKKNGNIFLSLVVLDLKQHWHAEVLYGTWTHNLPPPQKKNGNERQKECRRNCISGFVYAESFLS